MSFIIINIQTIENSSSYEIQNRENSQANTSALEKEILQLEDKLKSLQQDMQKYPADKARGALGVNEMMNTLRQA